MIDLRSDTVTKPSDAMRTAMFHAEVGDDVYGDDATANSLEERVAALFGFEAGLFTPTGSLANQLAIRQLVKPGEELLTETFSHIVRAELGAGAAFSGITTRTWESPRGALKAADPLRIARPDSGPYQVSTTAIAVENTHNFGGGTIQSLDEIRTLRSESLKLGLTLHLDGARIWNAHVATGVSLLEYGKHFDTVSVCFSKGLGAPVGSMVLSNKERISSARVWRKRYGAGMRQIGSLAAAVRGGLSKDPRTLPRRPGRDPSHTPLTQAEIALLDRIKEDRDKIAAKISIEPTLIANRSQLSQIARAPSKLSEVLLPWQAGLLAGAPSLKT